MLAITRSFEVWYTHTQRHRSTFIWGFFSEKKVFSSDTFPLRKYFHLSFKKVTEIYSAYLFLCLWSELFYPAVLNINATLPCESETLAVINAASEGPVKMKHLSSKALLAEVFFIFIFHFGQSTVSQIESGRTLRKMCWASGRGDWGDKLSGFHIIIEHIESDHFKDLGRERHSPTWVAFSPCFDFQSWCHWWGRD